LAAFHVSLAAEIGHIRQSQEVIEGSSSLLKIRVISITSLGCDGKYDKYVAKPLVVYRGKEKALEPFEFCGYAGLNTATTYIVGLESNKPTDSPRLYPDAIFIERMPGDFYRALSYESDKYDCGGKTLMVVGTKIIDFETLVYQATGQQP
jgi:hypothetical protein